MLSRNCFACNCKVSDQPHTSKRVLATYYALWGTIYDEIFEEELDIADFKSTIAYTAEIEKRSIVVNNIIVTSLEEQCK